MKELIQITDAEFALLCYIKEVARERVNAMDDYKEKLIGTHAHLLSYFLEKERNAMIVDVINILLDAHCAVEAEE